MDVDEALLTHVVPQGQAPLDVAEGYRMLTRLLRGSLESRLEYGDPLHPELICVCHETIKIVAENPDNHYPVSYTHLTLPTILRV